MTIIYGMVLLFLLIGVGIKYYNKSEPAEKKANINIVIFTILLILTLMSGFLIFGIMEPKVEISNERIIISGMYKRTIDTSDISEITLEDNIPKVLNKLNGFDFGYTLRGTFNLEAIGVANIYINEDVSPYIVIKTKDRIFIINYKNPEKTRELFNTIEDSAK